MNGSEPQSSTELQREVTRLALAALDGTGFALAGSGAIREHGVTDRLTEDVDLFTSNVSAENFGRSVAQVREQLQSSGYITDEARRSDQFARLHVYAPDGAQVDIDMGMDWRAAEPVTLSVGPVLSLEDAVGNKVSALYSRAEPRDFLDLDAIRSSGRFTDRQLIMEARERDNGFEVPMFATQLERAQHLTLEELAEYGVDAEALAAMQGRLGQWATELRAGGDHERAADNVRRFANLDIPLQPSDLGNSTPPPRRIGTQPEGRAHDGLGK